uniref:N-6 DNA methylase n=1 Tax=uncultured Rhizobium sp. TaxID=155567 RepID=UPI002605CF72|nr:N-6 DNA methylase [uncultured Rhizobium sp.]
MVSLDDQIGILAGQHGLARASLFRSSDLSPKGDHEVLLDGAYGSFAVSVAEDVDPVDASSWVWSSNIPHHVLLKGEKVRVLRWDRPDDASEFDSSRVLGSPAEFYNHLRSDRTQDRRSIVEHSVSLFNRVRSLVRHKELPDEKSISVYLTLLSMFAGEQQSGGRGVSEQMLPDGARQLLSSFHMNDVEGIYKDFQTLRLGNRSLAADVSLAMRHASGAIFQEAHYNLIQTPPPDLFNYLGPAVVRKPARGGVHFTPPFLARALSEQVLLALGNLHSRKQITIADIACGSAAFLVEALRALERFRYQGQITLIGRDTSSVAIDMARFVLGMASQEWQGNQRVKIDLAVADSLRTKLGYPVDVVVMNPPFARWQELDPAQREYLSATLGKNAGPKPDLSTAFVECALDLVKRDGAIATLLPANALDAKSASSWRYHLAERKGIYLSALFDDQTIFSHARVRVGALVLSGNAVDETIRLHAGTHPESAGDSLRALRLRRWGVADAAGFSVSIEPSQTSSTVRSPSSKAEAHFDLNLGRLRPLTQIAKQTLDTTVVDVFEVRQGIRTGDNATFVLDEAQWSELPAAERRFFRAAISSKGIAEGEVTRLFHVFYPYRSADGIGDETELRQLLPRYSATYLEPNRNKLAQRRDKSNRWWELSWPRIGMETTPPTFVSKYWAKPGGIVRHEPVDALVLQGFGWVVRQSMESALAVNERKRIEFAYLSLLNSATFFSLVAEHAPPTGGGQYDMSPRYLLDVPLPDLFKNYHSLDGEIGALAHYAASRDKPKLNAEIESIVTAILGLDQRLSDSRVAMPGSTLPTWAMPFVESGLEGTERQYRVSVLGKLQELAQLGNYVEINAALDASPVSKLAETSMMTLLRGTYRFKAKLKDWDGFRDRVAFELGQRGQDVKRLLVGLYE